MMEVGDAEREGGGSREKGTSKVINELAKMKGKVRTKSLKLSSEKPIKTFPAFFPI